MASVPDRPLFSKVDARSAPTGLELELLAALTEMINSDLDLSRVLQTVTDVGTQLSGAQFGAFFYNDTDDRGEIYQLHILSGAGLETFASMPAPRITALFEPTFNGEATVRVRDVSVDPRLTGLPIGHLPVRSYLATPVLGRSGDVIGSLLFGHAEPDVFDELCERTIRVVATQAAVAVENARLFAAEQLARRRAEAATTRLALLQALTGRLAAALTDTDALEVLVDTLPVPLGATWVALFQRVDGGYRAVRSDHPDLASTPLVPRLRDSVPNPVSDAAASGHPVLITTMAEFVETYPELATGMNQVASAVALPLQGSGGVAGAVALAWRFPREFDHDDVDMLVAAAGQVASTLERARLFEAERVAREQLNESIQAATEVSQALQRSLLPRSLPKVEGVSVAVRYLPSSIDVEVGGDWYDAVATEDGITLVIGDVQGHSLSAAALMGQLRTGLHAYLAEGHRLEAAVARASRLLREINPNIMATCCVAHLDRTRNTLQIVRAGHPNPLIWRRGVGVSEIAAAVGVPLGVLPDATWPVTTVELHPGDRLVFFTDGLVERRDFDIDDGIARLGEIVADTSYADVATAADMIVSTIGHELADDVALLVCELDDVFVSRMMTSLQVTAQPEQVGQARAFTRSALAGWGLTELEDDATLIVSEMVTNVLRHTESVAALEIRRDGPTVRISVSDQDSRHPRVNEHPDKAASGGRGMKLVTSLASAWGVQPRGTGKTVWAELTAP